jgi:hypothetical protein
MKNKKQKRLVNNTKVPNKRTKGGNKANSSNSKWQHPDSGRLRTGRRRGRRTLQGKQGCQSHDNVFLGQGLANAGRGIHQFIEGGRFFELGDNLLGVQPEVVGFVAPSSAERAERNI